MIMTRNILYWPNTTNSVILTRHVLSCLGEDKNMFVFLPFVDTERRR